VALENLDQNTAAALLENKILWNIITRRNS
jgi:hypothetical protein